MQLDDVCETCGQKKPYPTKACSCSSPNLVRMLGTGLGWYLQGFAVWIVRGLVWAASFLIVGITFATLKLAFSGQLPWYGWLILLILSLLVCFGFIVRIKSEGQKGS